MYAALLAFLVVSAMVFGIGAIVNKCTKYEGEIIMGVGGFFTVISAAAFVGIFLYKLFTSWGIG